MTPTPGHTSARRRFAVASVVGAAALGLSAAAYAVGAAGSDTTIFACAKNASPHTLTRSSDGACPTGTTPLSWNAHGPRGLQGVPGPAGAQGPQGPQGIQGPAGLTGFHTVTASTGTVPAGNLGAIDVSCAAGETAVSAGYTVPYTATVLESHPRSENPGVWTVAAAFPTVAGVLSVQLQCAIVTPGAAAAAAPRTAAPAAKLDVRVTPLPH